MCCHSQSCHMMTPIRVAPPPPQTSVRVSAGVDPEGSLHQQQNCSHSCCQPLSMPTGHSSNCSGKTVFSVSGTEFHRYPFGVFFLPPQDGANRSGKTQAQGQPPTIPGQCGEQSKLKHNFSSSPPIFQDDSGSLQKNYEFPSTATPC